MQLAASRSERSERSERRARASDGLAFAIISAGPALTPAEQDAYGIEHQLRRDGFAEAEITEAITYATRLNAFAVAGVPYATAEVELFSTARGRRWYDAYIAVDEPEMWTYFLRNAAFDYEPITAIKRIRCPVLAIFGERDVLLPAEESAAVYQRLLGQRQPGRDHRRLPGRQPPHPRGR